jgi:hypothetical protein
VERGDEVHVFASLIGAKDPGAAFGPARTAVPRAVLRALGIPDSASR